MSGDRVGRRFAMICALGLGLGACSAPHARDISYGREACAHCHMTISDPRFAGELVMSKGLIYTFDDIECLAGFASQNDGADIHSIWVNDFLHPEQRLDATRARYWQNPRFRSPMSSGLVAVKEGPESDSLAGVTGAVLQRWHDVVVSVRATGGHRLHQPAVVTASVHGASAVNGQAQDLVVSTDGPVRTLSAALRLARPHSRIVVRAGTYREPMLVIDKPVAIEGEGWPTFIGTDHDVFRITADSVSLRGVVIRDVQPTAAEDRAAIRVSGARGCVIENNRLVKTFFGVYLARATDCRIQGNWIQGQGTIQGLSGNAIHSWNSADLTIANNQISGHRDGIYLEFTGHSRITGNRSTANLRYGLHFMFSHRCEYAGNTFSRNGSGVAVMFSDSVVMRENRFQKNWGSSAYGLLLKDLRDSWIEQNQFADNTVGLWTEGTSRVTITGNEFLGNGWALRVLGDATDNRFVNNRFSGNSFDVGTAPGLNSNIFEGNYWDHYRGYDLDRDGYGDVPFQPVRLFSLFIEQNEPAVILLHSFFIDLLDLAERVMPTLTPATMMDKHPLMRWDS
jgi:nitrous oxidase accessory protein